MIYTCPGQQKNEELGKSCFPPVWHIYITIIMVLLLRTPHIYDTDRMFNHFSSRSSKKIVTLKNFLCSFFSRGSFSINIISFLKVTRTTRQLPHAILKEWHMALGVPISVEKSHGSNLCLTKAGALCMKKVFSLSFFSNSNQLCIKHSNGYKLAVIKA